MDEGKCPICGDEAKLGPGLGDDSVVICSHCGGYRLGGRAEQLLINRTLDRPNKEKFRKLVKRKRGDSDDYPLITEHDLRSLE